MRVLHAPRFFVASVGRLVGPAAVMAAGTMGAGAMAAFLLAGAWFGYGLLWVIPLMLPVFVISADSASRLGALNPRRGLFTLIREEIGRPLAWAILLLVVPVHFLVCMGQISVMAATTRGLLAPGLADIGWPGESLLALGLAAATLWLVLSRGYDRMQWAMTLLMLLMFLCFLLVALRGFADVQAILAGFRPRLPAPAPLGPGEAPRLASTSIIAMVGSAIAPAALLGLPYLSADAGGGRKALSRALRLSVINLGLVFGAYAVLVVVAGSYALHSLPGYAHFADVAEAREVLRAAFPGRLASLGPVVFSLGLLTAAMTTLVVAAQVTVYFVLDMVGQPWRFTEDNRVFHRCLVVFILAAALLAPLWQFPALLKVILLMGINVVVVPAAFLVVLILSNRGSVMRGVITNWWRNALLVVGLVTSLALAVHKTPQYLAMF